MRDSLVNTGESWRISPKGVVLFVYIQGVQ